MIGRFNIIIFLVLSSFNFAIAQESVHSEVNTSKIKIGEAIEYKIQAETSEQSKVIFPQLNSVGDFEVLESSPIDTVLADKKLTLIKKYFLTKFDSGSYTIPRQSVFINGKNFQTNLFDIQVSNVKVDTLKQPLYDIKANIGKTQKQASLIYYLLALVVSLIIGVLVFFYIKHRQKKLLTDDDLFRTPLEKAHSKLDAIDGKGLVVKGEVKEYYSQVTEVLREYIEEVFEISTKEATSSQLLASLNTMIKQRELKLPKATVNDLKQVLQTADLVKFAKLEPSISQTSENREKTVSIVKQMDDTMPKIKEEQSLKIRLREERFKKRKRARIVIPLSVVAFLVFITGITYLFQSDFSNSWFAVFNSSKKVYNQQWTQSSYGFPEIVMQTPEPMVRQSIANTHEKALSGSFKYKDNNLSLTVQLTTIPVPASEEGKSLDFELLLNQHLNEVSKSIKAKGFKSTIQKTVSQQEAVAKANSEFKLLEKKSDKEKSFEMQTEVYSRNEQLYFVDVIYEVSDIYGKNIASKVFESVEFNAQ